MTILALETSSQAASCAIWRDDMLLGESYVNAGLTHSQTIMPMVEELLKSTRMDLKQVDIFAVSTGPGSFTGLRIGLSAVKGMAMALNKPCAAVSTLHGLAMNAVNVPGIIVPVLDARRKQVYAAAFKSDGSRLTRLWEDGALSMEALGEKLAALPGHKLLVGDGAALCKTALPDTPQLYAASPQLRYQRASAVAAIAAAMPEEELLSASALSPAYLRLPQAERELKKKEAQQKQEDKS